MVLLSGGKDSAFLLHRLRLRHPKLRLLTVLVNNGFMSPIALDNSDRLRRSFAVDHAELSPDGDFVRSAFRWALTHLDRQEGYSIVDSLDGQITFDTAQNRAAEWGIPLVIAGLSKAQIENSFGAIGWKFPSDTMEWIAPGVTRRDVSPDPNERHWYRPERWPAERRPEFLLPFVLWDPTETHIIRTVSELGLIDPRRLSPLLTNNRLISVIILAEIAKFGYCCFEVEFARMIRDGKAERSGWLSTFQLFEYRPARADSWVTASPRPSRLSTSLPTIWASPPEPGRAHGPAGQDVSTTHPVAVHLYEAPSWKPQVLRGNHEPAHSHGAPRAAGSPGCASPHVPSI
jgi:hypothetical protein